MSIEQETFVNDSLPNVNSDWLNSVTEEINNFIKAFVENLSGGNRSQFLQGFLKASLGQLTCSLDSTSTGTQYNIFFKAPFFKSISLLDYFDGMLLWIDNTIENTGPCKVNLLGKGSKNIFKMDGSPLAGGELKEGFLLLTYDQSLDAFKKCNIV